MPTVWATSYFHVKSFDFKVVMRSANGEGVTVALRGRERVTVALRGREGMTVALRGREGVTVALRERGRWTTAREQCDRDHTRERARGLH